MEFIYNASSSSGFISVASASGDFYASFDSAFKIIVFALGTIIFLMGLGIFLHYFKR
jgi:hypothetical protein